MADSKFGFGLATGDAEAAIAQAGASAAMELVGVHAHIGSQVFSVDSFRRAIEVLAPFVVASRSRSSRSAAGWGSRM